MRDHTGYIKEIIQDTYKRSYTYKISNGCVSRYPEVKRIEFYIYIQLSAFENNFEAIFNLKAWCKTIDLPPSTDHRLTKLTSTDCRTSYNILPTTNQPVTDDQHTPTYIFWYWKMSLIFLTNACCTI